MSVKFEPISGAAIAESSEGDSIVYIVDDDADVREGLQALLESIGLRSVGFASTTEFLRSRTESSDEVRCLILDVRVPGLGGLGLQDELAASGISIPIIFISGYGDVPMTVKAMKAGAIEFLTKPLRDQDVLDAVRLALDQGRARMEQEKKERELRRNFDMLTMREKRVLALVAAGLMNKQIAAEMGISEAGVKVHRRTIMTKLAVRSVADLVRIAEALGVHRPHIVIAIPRTVS